MPGFFSVEPLQHAFEEEEHPMFQLRKKNIENFFKRGLVFIFW